MWKRHSALEFQPEVGGDNLHSKAVVPPFVGSGWQKQHWFKFSFFFFFQVVKTRYNALQLNKCSFSDNKYPGISNFILTCLGLCLHLAALLWIQSGSFLNKYTPSFPRTKQNMRKGFLVLRHTWKQKELHWARLQSFFPSTLCLLFQTPWYILHLKNFSR